jgi:hypothetical protein
VDVKIGRQSREATILREIGIGLCVAVVAVVVVAMLWLLVVCVRGGRVAASIGVGALLVAIAGGSFALLQQLPAPPASPAYTAAELWDNAVSNGVPERVATLVITQATGVRPPGGANDYSAEYEKYLAGRLTIDTGHARQVGAAFDPDAAPAQVRTQRAPRKDSAAVRR